MSELNASTDDLNGAAHSFSEAAKDSQELIGNLDAVTKSLGENWEGATQQAFYKQYLEWRNLMGGMALLLENIAQELNSFADGLEKADRS